MTTTRRSRRLALRPASAGRVRTTRTRAPELELDDPSPIASWTDRTITAQLADPYLVAGRLPSMAVGEILELAPKFWMACYSPAADHEPAWWGGVGRSARPPPAVCSCRPTRARACRCSCSRWPGACSR